jgi:serine/threonine-protein kinase
VKHARRSALDRAVASVADGASGLDWDEIERDSRDDNDKQLIRQLRILASISDVHRSHAGDESDHEANKIIGRITPGAVAAPAEASGVAAASSSEAGALPKPADIGLGWWGPLQLLERVGEGTFGEVYRALDTQLQREVAVKLLRPGRSSARLSERMLREARVLARLHHQNVVVIHGVETRDGRVGLWMEHIRGATLEDLLTRQGAFSAREAALIGQDLCRALAAVHSAGLIHRDIKAQNVMREEGGRVVLMDFGAGQIVDDTSPDAARPTGTPLYLAPEVLEGADASRRSDIYSLGVLLYRLVTGEFPVRGGSVEDLRAAHAAGRVVRLHDARPDLPDGFVRAVETALERDPTKRFATSGELLSMLSVAAGVDPSAHAIDRRSWRAVARRLPRVASYGLAVAAVVLAVAVVWTRWRVPVVAEVGTLAPARVAVLPFDRGADIAAYVADDLVRRTADALGADGSIRVASRDTGLALKVSQAAFAPGPPAGIDLVLDGRLEITPGGMRASVALIPWGKTTAVWQRAIEASVSRLPDAIASEVRDYLAPGARGRLHHVQTSAGSEAAVELAARARFAIEHGPDREDTAIRYFKQAIAADPLYAKAYSGLARALLGHGCTQANAMTLAARHALGLDPELAEAHTVLGDVLLRCEWNWAAAEAEYRAAIAANPSDEFSRLRFAMFLAGLGRTKEALPPMRQARELDYHSPTAAAAFALLLSYDGQLEEARAEVARAVDMDPQYARGYLAQGRILAAMGRYTEAARSFAQARVLDGRILGAYFDAEIAAADAGLGRVREARRFVHDAERDPGSKVPAEMIAFVYARLGDRDKAFEWLNRGIDRHSDRLLWLKVDPRAASLRDDPRFEMLVSRLEMPAK